MKEDNNYFQKCEDIGDEKFINWTDSIGIFSKRERLPLLSRIDWRCETPEGIIVNCELKVRNSLKYDTIFIEPGKYNNLIREWNEYKRIPLYINFCEDETVVFDLRKCNVNDVGEIRIWDGYNKCYEMVHRFSLNKNEGIRYIKGIKQINN